MNIPARPTVSIVIPCYNEEGNVEPLYERLLAVFRSLPQIRFQTLFIDNASRDATQQKLRALASQDPNLKVIINERNFGNLRSPLHAFFQVESDAIICMACDLQDPPELIREFIRLWQGGLKVVVGIKPRSQESRFLFAVRKIYYRLLNKISEVPLIENFTGFGLYDRVVVEALRAIPDRRPYVRGLIADLGYSRGEVPFTQPRRERGISSNGFYSLFDVAMLGMTSHSRVPLRLATMAGFVLGAISLLVAFGYLIAKLVFWDHFALGQAPVLIGVFFFGSVQMFFVGILGEYIGAIHAQLHPRPWVVERERINFEPGRQ